jgi:hypothetical protein
MISTLKEARKDGYDSRKDPIARGRAALRKPAEEVARIEEEIDRLVSEAVEKALAPGEKA